MERRDLIILGGGVGGLIVASVASQLGLKTTLIEKSEHLGGDCLHHGCVPSKSLLKAAQIAHQLQCAANFGVDHHHASLDNSGVMERVRSVISHIQRHDDPDRFRRYGCEVLFGDAHFIDRQTLSLDGRQLQGRRFVIATGARPFVPSIDGLKEAGYLTNESLFDLYNLPDSLAILGGGPIGIEMAQAFARLGTRVTVIHRGTQILPQEPEAASSVIKSTLIADGVNFIADAALMAVEEGSEGRKRLICEVRSREHHLEVDELLIAIGRRPNTEGLGLEQAEVKTGRMGIEVDRRMRSSNPRIYACGDVCGPYQFTHMAEYQAGIVLSNAIFHWPKKTDYRVVPRVTYTDPELASIGMSEKEVRQSGIPYDVISFDFHALDRAIIDGEEHGFVRYLVRRGPRWRHGGEIIGAVFVGPRAGELLHEIALAMQARLPISLISATIHAYPTLSQVHRRAVNSYYAPKLFNGRVKALVKLLKYF